MFGMGFMEIFLVAIVAIIALGPEKLPTAMVDMAKFFKKLKGGLEDAKTTLDQELNISQMKEEAEKFKASVADVKSIASVDVSDLTELDTQDLEEDKPKEKKSEYQDIPKTTVKKENISLKEEAKV
ncbi:MAG: Sec-independent protein translocase protein TatB [Campylobacterota bacterium]|nr:Sec-independent protein translocase protein TatB [Campylobacterota bacterium]